MKEKVKYFGFNQNLHSPSKRASTVIELSLKKGGKVDRFACEYRARRGKLI